MEAFPRSLRLTLCIALVGCGGAGPSGLGDGGGQPDATVDIGDGAVDPCLANPQLCIPDDALDAPPPCEGLKCQQVMCGGSVTTTVSGVVWDPAGKNPLYDVVVYVPNAPLDPIKHGPSCDSCSGAPISGKPIVTTLTDAKGKFVLKDVPVGANIPLVIQAGKWRRKITLPMVAQCVDNPITTKDTTRLPKNKSEGDMPLIAFVAGCDPLQTVIQKFGIDVAEFTNGAGTGTVHVYAGVGNQNGGVQNATDAYAFWGNKATMLKYDMIINACECQPQARDTQGPAYANMKEYLDAGGRVWASHYQLNFFGPSAENSGKPDTSLQNAATWTLWSGSPFGNPPEMIDTTFPKGQVLDDWLENLKTASGWGAVRTSPKGQINSVSVGDIVSAKMGISQRWVYPGNVASVQTVTFNTPTTAMPSKRCGRAMVSDLHSGTNMNMGTMIESEAEFEFLFFDLAACVIDDSIAPVAPPPF